MNDFLILPNCCRSHPARLNMHPAQAFVWVLLFFFCPLVNKNPAWMCAAVLPPCFTVILAVAGNLQVSLSNNIQLWDERFSLPDPTLIQFGVISSPGLAAGWEVRCQTHRVGGAEAVWLQCRPPLLRSSDDCYLHSDHREAEKQLGCSHPPTVLLTCRMWSHVDWHLHWHGQAKAGSEIKRIQNILQEHSILMFLFAVKRGWGLGKDKKHVAAVWRLLFFWKIFISGDEQNIKPHHCQEENYGKGFHVECCLSVQRGGLWPNWSMNHFQPT